jgi:type IV pilus assembly protein PilY1
MSTRIARWLTAAAAGSALFWAPDRAHAQQVDTNPPLPNVLLMIDNSGSMERMIDGTLPEDNPATNGCNVSGCTVSGAVTTCSTWGPSPANMNRWNILLRALTGTLTNGYNCISMPRTAGGDLATEYSIGGASPYDTGYYLPFHRAVAMDTTTSPGKNTPCVYAPGSLPGTTTPNGVGPNGLGSGGVATDFQKGGVAPIVTRPYGQSKVSTNTCNFARNTDGALDSSIDLMRFGLMTFDQDTDASIGVTPGATAPNPTVLPAIGAGCAIGSVPCASAFTGMWSYFPGWNGTGGAPTPASGNPLGCSSQPFEVGARSPAAPPWEGRMVTFPSDNQDATRRGITGQLEQVLMATRPYGATPIAGMFADAQYYFWNDPAGPQQTDSYLTAGSGGPCRNESIILLTDGAPNLDLRPSCGAQSGAPCPYVPADTTAATLLAGTGGNQKVSTYVLGFAVSSVNDGGTLVGCSTVDPASPTGPCQSGTPAQQQLYASCCQLQKIAIAGGTGHAYFADTPADLQTALAAILGNIAKKTTTRTTPSYSPVSSYSSGSMNAPSNESVYLASFNPTVGFPWSGDVQRQRYQCVASGTTFTVPPPTVTTSLGDDFAANLNSNAGKPRQFIAIHPGASGLPVDSAATLRPYVSATPNDKLGNYGATVTTGIASVVIPSLAPAELGIASSYAYNSIFNGQPRTLSTAQATTMVLDYTFAQQSFAGPADFPFVTRFGNALGDVFHANPAFVGRPNSLLQDPLYIAFQGGSVATRPRVVYVATNDGLLHAFDADVDSLTNNELWAMLLPAAMPNLITSYPGSHQFLLDGSPQVKDVVWDRSVTATAADKVWHTMLLAAYGPYQQGYYALDVTDSSAPTGVSGVGPVFRWQLTKLPGAAAGSLSAYQILAAHSATPAITSLVMDPGDGGGTREIGVAILPGGSSTGPTLSGGSPISCARCMDTSKCSASTTDALPASGYARRKAVRCWGATGAQTDPVPGRSLSVVRIDTGEVIRTFARLNDVPATDPLFVAKRIVDTPLDSPMTGTPIVYPTDVGADATKVFLGDADGTLWRFDLSNPNPSLWVGEMYLDLYNQVVDTTVGTSWSDGQPFEVTPVLSLDPSGNLVINATTGTTETYDNKGLYYVYSITETVGGTPIKLRASVNWWLNPATVKGGSVGERVSGPMTVFNGTLYFATFAASAPGSQTCSSGAARIWGRDYIRPADATCATTPATCDRSLGGVPELQPPALAVTPAAQFAGSVIPGVAIQATPGCASSASEVDPYIGGSRTVPQNFTAGSYSLVAQVGAAGGPNGSGTQPLQMSLPTPMSPTAIDSWAAVVE